MFTDFLDAHTDRQPKKVIPTAPCGCRA